MFRLVLNYAKSLQFRKLLVACTMQNELAQKIIDHVRANPGCDRTDICSAVGANFDTLAAIRALIENGTIREEQSGVRTHFFIA